MNKQEKTKKIEEIYQNAIRKMNEHGQKALSLINSLIKKREGKKVEELSKKLKE